MADRILSEANEQAGKIVEQAQARAQKIVEDAKKEATERGSRLVVDGKKEIDRLREQQTVELRVQNKRKIYALQWHHVDSLVQATFSEMEKIRGDEDQYRKYLSGLVSNAIRTLKEKEVVIHFDRRDSSLMNQIVKKIDMPDTTIRLLPDITSAGGAVISSKGGSKEIDGTIEAVLRTKYQALREEGFRHLFGDFEIAD